MIPVQSSNIASIGYDPESKLMHVEFKDGATYKLHGVEAEEYRQFMAAPSKGAHYHTHFKTRHTGKVGE